MFPKQLGALVRHHHVQHSTAALVVGRGGGGGGGGRGVERGVVRWVKRGGKAW